MVNDTRRKFLEYFPNNKRATVANEFLKPIRKDAPIDAIQIVRAVENNCNPAGKRYDTGKNYICEAIRQFFSEALEYAKYCFDWEQLSYEEKDKIKRERGKTAILEHMEKEAPTEKQIKYLRSLGYVGAGPQSKGEACKLIDDILVRKKWSSSHEWV